MIIQGEVFQRQRMDAGKPGGCFPVGLRGFRFTFSGRQQDATDTKNVLVVDQHVETLQLDRLYIDMFFQ